MEATLRIVRERPLAFALVAIAAFAFGASLVPYAFLPVRTLLYRGATGVLVLAIWFTALGLLFAAGRRFAATTDARVLVALQVLIGGAIAILTPVLLSTDPIAYVYYGSLALAGGDPWHPPAAAGAPIARELADAMRQLYGDPPVASIYGPAFVFVETLFMRAFISAPLPVAIFAQRGLALAAWAAITPLLAPERRARWATDPFLLFVFAFDAHNDALFLLPVALAFRLPARTWRGAVGAGLAIGVAAGVKITALAALLVRPLAIPVTVAALALWTTLQPGAWTLAPHRVQSALLFGLAPTIPIWLILLARVTVLVAIGVWGATRIRERADWAAYGTIVLICALPVVHPWYVSWAVLLAAQPQVSPAMSRWIATLEGIVLLHYVADVF